jgi:hypothetical protein
MKYAWDRLGNTVGLVLVEGGGGGVGDSYSAHSIAFYRRLLDIYCICIKTTCRFYLHLGYLLHTTHEKPGFYVEKQSSCVGIEPA